MVEKDAEMIKEEEKREGGRKKAFRVLLARRARRLMLWSSAGYKRSRDSARARLCVWM